MGTEAGLKAQENRRKIHQKHLELWHLCWQRRKTTLLKCHRMCKIDIWGRGNWKQPWPQLIICIIFYNWHRRHVELVKQHKRETSNLAIFQHFLCCFLSAWFTSAPSVYFFYFFLSVYCFLSCSQTYVQVTSALQCWSLCFSSLKKRLNVSWPLASCNRPRSRCFLHEFDYVSDFSLDVITPFPRIVHGCVLIDTDTSLSASSSDAELKQSSWHVQKQKSGRILKMHLPPDSVT